MFYIIAWLSCILMGALRLLPICKLMTILGSKWPTRLWATEELRQQIVQLYIFWQSCRKSRCIVHLKQTTTSPKVQKNTNIWTHTGTYHLPVICAQSLTAVPGFHKTKCKWVLSIKSVKWRKSCGVIWWKCQMGNHHCSIAVPGFIVKNQWNNLEKEKKNRNWKEESQIAVFGCGIVTWINLLKIAKTNVSGMSQFEFFWCNLYLKLIPRSCFEVGS